MIDTHAHLDHARFGAALESELLRAARVGVSGWVVPGVDPEERAARRAVHRTLQTTRFASAVRFAVGVHPRLAARGPLSSTGEDPLEQSLLDEARELDAVAIGETGFDKSRPEFAQTLPAQERAFFSSVQVARELGLPLIVHVVRAEAELLGALKALGGRGPRGVIHGFGGGPESAEQYVRRGFFISFGPALLRRAAHGDSPIIRAAQSVPADRLLVETDAPDQAPDLATIGGVLGVLAKLRGEDPAELSAVVRKNAQALFACSFGP